MSIASEFESTIENLKSDYEGLENIGADLTNIDKNIYNIRTCLDNIYSNLPKTTGEGSNLSLSPTLKGKLNIEASKGNTQQDKTNGYNMLKLAFSNDTTNVAGLTFSHTDSTFTLSGTTTSTFKIFNLSNTLPITNGESYTISANVTGTCPSMYITINCYDSSNNNIFQIRATHTNGYVQTKTASLSATIDHCSFVIEGLGNNTAYNLKAEVMFEKGSTKHDYEPYTNGASPNPTYPQDINVVTGEQEVLVQNKNFFKEAPAFTPENVNWKDNFGNLMGNVSAVESSPNYYDLIGGQTYTFKIDSYANINNWQLVYISDNTLASITQKGTNVTDSKTFTPSINMRVWYRNSNSDTTTQYYCKAQLEKGSTATAYVPNEQQIKKVNLGKNLLEIKNIERTISGVTFTPQDDGSILVNGTASAVASYPLNVNSATNTRTLQLEANSTYVLSGVMNADIQVQGYFLKNNTNTYTNRNNPVIETAEATLSAIYIRVASGVTIDNLKVYPMLEKGGIATDFAKYFTPIELCKIGTYQDRIYKNNDKWYIEKNIGKYTFTGNETYTLSATANVFYIQNWVDNILYENDNRPYCTCYSGVGPVGSASTMGAKEMNTIAVANTSGTNGKRLFIKTDNYSTTTAIASGNKGNIVYYLISTPAYEEITNTNLLNELNELEKIMSYNGTTNINISGNLPMLVSVSALKGE